MATLLDLRNAFRTETGDTISAGYLFSDAEVNGWLNESVREACVRADLILDDSTTSVCSISVAIGDFALAASPLITNLRHARLAYNSGVVRYLEIKDRGWLDYTNPTWRDYAGEPSELTFKSTAIRLVGKASAAGTLKMDVYRLPLAAMANNTDTPEIPTAYHDGLIYWALHRAFSKRDPDTYDQTRADYYEGIFTGYFGLRPNAAARETMARGGARVTRMRW